MQEVEVRNQRNSTSNVVFQPSRLKEVTLLSGQVSMGDRGFFIKIDSTDPVTLRVQYLLGKSWIETTFFPGWNPDIIYSLDTDYVVPEGTLIKIGF